MGEEGAGASTAGRVVGAAADAVVAGAKVAGRVTRKAASTVAGAAGTVKDAAGNVVEKVTDRFGDDDEPRTAG